MAATEPKQTKRSCLFYYPKQKELLDKILAGPLFTAAELPPVPDELRAPPEKSKGPKKEFKVSLFA